VRHGLDTSFLVAVEVACHKDHEVARRVMKSLRQKDDRFALAPQVLAEFVHIVTDPKRFSSPLTIELALGRAEAWWNSKEVDWALPDESTVAWFLAAMAKGRLGRKRLLDTLLAGTFRTAGVHSMLTLNSADFSIFDEFECVPIG
jgi:predicted nucleic acid-binding protein